MRNITIISPQIEQKYSEKIFRKNIQKKYSKEFNKMK
jgi:hypothetical protein